MLDLLRKASRTWAAKLLFILLVGSFAIWGVSASVMAPGGNAVVTVGDQTVKPEEFRLAYQRQLAELGRQFGTRLTTEQARAFGIDRQVIAQLAAGAALDQLSDDMKLGLSEDRLASLIAADPAFQAVNGQFDRNLFSQRLANSGLRENDYIVERSKVAVRSQIVEAISDGFTPPDVLVNALRTYRNEQRAIDYLILSNANIDPVKTPGDDVLTKWFEGAKSRYKAPQYRSFTFVRLEPEDIADAGSITDDAIAAYYESHKASYRTAGKRTIEQLSFPDKEMAEAAANQLRDGMTTFDQVIKDQGKTASDVMLGEFAHNDFPDAAIADAAFAISKDGGTSPVVEGAFGPVILRVTGIRAEATRTLDEAREEIRAELAKAAAVEELQNVHDRFEDLRASGASLVDSARELKLTPVTVEAIDATGNDKSGEPVKNLPLPNLVSEVFKAEPGAETPPLDIGRDGYVWYEVGEVTPERDRDFLEVRETVVADWTAEQQRNALTAKADELKARAEKGETLAAIAAELGIAVENKQGLRRNTDDAVLGQQAVLAAFSGAEGLVAAAQGADAETRILLKVTAIDTEAPADPLSDDDRQITNVARAAGDDILDQMVGRLQTEYGVTVNQTLADQAMVQ